MCELNNKSTMEATNEQTNIQQDIMDSPILSSKRSVFDEFLSRSDSSLTITRTYPKKGPKSPEKVLCFWRPEVAAPIRYCPISRQPSKYSRINDVLLELDEESIDERAAYWGRYWDDLRKTDAEHASNTLRFAPLPNEITPKDQKNKSFTRFKSEDDDGSVHEEEVYISRSGRQCKRKAYAEDNSWDNIDLEITSTSKKRNKPELVISDDEDLKITLDEPYIPDRNHNKVKLTRTEKMVEKAKSQTKSKQEIEKENFYNSLENVSDDDDIIEDSQQSTTFVRKRIVPPAGQPRKRAKVNKKLFQERNDSETAGPSAKRQQTSLSLNRVDEEPSDMATCPLCQKLFSQEDIQKHAWDCTGITNEPSESKSAVNGDYSPMKACELCDKVFPLQLAMQHMKECINKHC